MDRRAVQPTPARNAFTVLDIRQEQLPQLGRNARIVHDCRHLEIILETADIHIGRPDRTEIVVHDQQLGVIESLAVEIDLDAGIQHLTDVGTRCPIDNLAVRPAGQNDPHVNAAQRSHLQRRQHSLVGQKIRRGDIDRTPRPADGRKEGLHDGGPVGIGAGRGDLHGRTALYAALREIFLIAEPLLAADEIPVGHEDRLQHVDGIALDPQMQIPPPTERSTLNIPVRHIDAARKADPAVDNGNLAVIAVIELACQPGEHNRHETVHPNAVPAETAHIPPLQAPAAHIIVNKPHLDPLGCLLLEQGDQLPADMVFLDDIVLQMDRRSGSPDGLEQRIELFLPAGQNLHLVAHRQQGPVVVQQQGDDILVGLDGLDVLDLGINQIAQLHPAEPVDLLEVVDLLAVENLLLPVVAAEHNVEDQPGHRQHGDHQNPRECLDRITPVIDNHHDRSKDDQHVQDRYHALDIRQGDYRKPGSVHTLPSNTLKNKYKHPSRLSCSRRPFSTAGRPLNQKNYALRRICFSRRKYLLL